MINICGECGFRKDCSPDEFWSHLWLHDDIEEIMNGAVHDIQRMMRDE